MNTHRFKSYSYPDEEHHGKGEIYFKILIDSLIVLCLLGDLITCGMYSDGSSANLTELVNWNVSNDSTWYATVHYDDISPVFKVMKNKNWEKLYSSWADHEHFLMSFPVLPGIVPIQILIWATFYCAIKLWKIYNGAPFRHLCSIVSCSSEHHSSYCICR